MVLCFAKESQLRHSSVDNYFLQRYNKKYTYASPLNKKNRKALARLQNNSLPLRSLKKQ